MKLNLLVWDMESAGTFHTSSSPIEIGGLYATQDFKELERFNFRCRLPEGEIPQAQSLIVNKTSVDMLTKANLSSYQMLGQVESIFKKFSPAIFLGWGNTEFDDSMIQNSFFRNLRYPYITNSSPNKRHDGLQIARGAYSVDSNILKTENTAKGNVSLSLPSVAKNNGIDFSGSHSAQFDSLMVCKVLSLIKKKQPDTWDSFLKTSSRADAETIIKRDKILTLKEVSYGKFYSYLVAPLHPNACIHPVYRYGAVIDLKFDIEPLLDLSASELRNEMKKKKFLRQIRLNKAPIILDSSYGIKLKPYNLIDPKLIKKRAEIIKSNEKFSQNLLTVLREKAEEKEQLKSQEDVLAEQTIHKFPPAKDTSLFPLWHAASWKDKLIMLDKFEDDRLVGFGKKIIYQESPSTLPETMYKKIRREIAERILSEEREKWWTCKEFYFECDNLREKFTNEKDEEKLKFLDELNAFVEGVEKKYREA